MRIDPNSPDYLDDLEDFISIKKNLIDTQYSSPKQLRALRESLHPKHQKNRPTIKNEWICALIDALAEAKGFKL